MKECKETHNVLGVPINKTLCTLCGFHGHSWKNCRNKGVKKAYCQKCSGFGHLKKDCTAKFTVYGDSLTDVKRCTRCNLFGHTMQECRETHTSNGDLISSFIPSFNDDEIRNHNDRMDFNNGPPNGWQNEQNHSNGNHRNHFNGNHENNFNVNKKPRSCSPGWGEQCSWGNVDERHEPNGSREWSNSGERCNEEMNSNGSQSWGQSWGQSNGSQSWGNDNEDQCNVKDEMEQHPVWNRSEFDSNLKQESPSWISQNVSSNNGTKRSRSEDNIPVDSKKARSDSDSSSSGSSSSSEDCDFSDVESIKDENDTAPIKCPAPRSENGSNGQWEDSGVW